NVMAQVAKPLSDEEIQSLASYLQGLHDRSDEASPEQVAAAMSAPAPAPVAAPTAPTTGEATEPAAARSNTTAH
ncbi:MAG: hypothetical protein ABIO38_08430, partial [Luteimonas sp.]